MADRPAAGAPTTGPTPVTKTAQRRARRIARLIKRDGNRCWICKRDLIPSQITFDHIVPKSKGGGNRLDNLALACRYCNGLRGAPDRPLVAGDAAAGVSS